MQRDRPIIKDLLQQIDHYCARNLKRRDERIEAERCRQHEAQHSKLGGSSDEVQGSLTAGEIARQNGQEEDEKEIDPSIVGSLDNVYKDEPGAEMREEDPFKKVPVLDDHDKPSSMMELEKSVDAMVALIEHSPGSPTLDEAASLDRECHSKDLLTSELNTESDLPFDLGLKSVDLLKEAREDKTDIPPPSQPVDGLDLTLRS